jgi:hypothetical protein
VEQISIRLFLPDNWEFIAPPASIEACETSGRTYDPERENARWTGISMLRQHDLRGSRAGRLLWRTGAKDVTAAVGETIADRQKRLEKI